MAFQEQQVSEYLWMENVWCIYFCLRSMVAIFFANGFGHWGGLYNTTGWSCWARIHNFLKVTSSWAVCRSKTMCTNFYYYFKLRPMYKRFPCFVAGELGCKNELWGKTFKFHGPRSLNQEWWNCWSWVEVRRWRNRKFELHLRSRTESQPWSQGFLKMLFWIASIHIRSLEPNSIQELGAVRRIQKLASGSWDLETIIIKC